MKIVRWLTFIANARGKKYSGHRERQWPLVVFESLLSSGIRPWIFVYGWSHVGIWRVFITRCCSTFSFSQNRSRTSTTNAIIFGPNLTHRNTLAVRKSELWHACVGEAFWCRRRCGKYERDKRTPKTMGPEILVGARCKRCVVGDNKNSHGNRYMKKIR